MFGGLINRTNQKLVPSVPITAAICRLQPFSDELVFPLKGKPGKYFPLAGDQRGVRCGKTIMKFYRSTDLTYLSTIIIVCLTLQSEYRHDGRISLHRPSWPFDWSDSWTSKQALIQSFFVQGLPKNV
jgi:hypothetical protein